MTRPHRHMIIEYADSPEGREIEYALIHADGLLPEATHWWLADCPEWQQVFAYRFADDPHRVSFPDGWRDMRPKLYQKRVEIPTPLTVEEAAECNEVWVPYMRLGGPVAVRVRFARGEVQAWAEQGLAYRTRDKALTRARGWVQTEGE